MKFRDGDELLSLSVVPEGSNEVERGAAEKLYVFVVFENGLAKRTPVEEYPTKGRATLGVKVATISERGGDLVGALVVENRDEVMVVMEKGKIVRSAVSEVRETGRNTQGVQFATPGKGDSIVAVARNAEKEAEEIADEQVGSDANTADDAEVTNPSEDAVTAENDESGDSE